MKVLFACVLGASTSMIARRVEGAARERGVEMNILVRAAHELSAEDLSAYDKFVLGPQVGYLRGALQKQMGETRPILVIPPREYGLGDGGRILDLILEAV